MRRADKFFKSYASKMSLLKGAGAETGSLPRQRELYNCLTCDRKYSYKTTLSRHLKFECGKAPRFQCSLCNYRSAQKNNVLRHIRSYHGALHPSPTVLDLTYTNFGIV